MTTATGNLRRRAASIATFPWREIGARAKCASLARTFDRLEPDWATSLEDDDGHRSRPAAHVRRLRSRGADLLGHLPELSTTTGCEFGSDLGLSTIILATVGPKLVYGIERHASLTERGERLRSATKLAARFRAVRDGVVPLKTSSIDWLIVRAAFRRAVPDAFAEARRILAPGGRIIVIESNAYGPTDVAPTDCPGADPFAVAGELEDAGFVAPRITIAPRDDRVANEVLWSLLPAARTFHVFAEKPQ